jgi:hypothetical protein
MYKPDSQRPRKVLLALREDEYTDGTYLVAVNEDGSAIPGGNLIHISSQGKVILCAGIAPGVNVPKNAAGQIIIDRPV